MNNITKDEVIYIKNKMTCIYRDLADITEKLNKYSLDTLKFPMTMYVMQFSNFVKMFDKKIEGIMSDE